MFLNFYKKILNKNFFIISRWYKLKTLLKLFLFQKFSHYWLNSLNINLINNFKMSKQIELKNKLMDYKKINKLFVHLICFDILKFMLTFFFSNFLSKNVNFYRYKSFFFLFQKFSHFSFSNLLISKTKTHFFMGKATTFYKMQLSFVISIYKAFLYFRIFKMKKLNNSHLFFFKLYRKYFCLKAIKTFKFNFIRYNNLLLFTGFRLNNFNLLSIQCNQIFNFLFNNVKQKTKNSFLFAQLFFHKYVLSKLNFIYFYDLNVLKFKYWNLFFFLQKLKKKNLFHTFYTYSTLKKFLLTINFFSFNLQKFLIYLNAYFQWVYSFIFIKNLKYNVLKKNLKVLKYQNDVIW